MVREILAGYEDIMCLSSVTVYMEGYVEWLDMP